MSCWIRKVNLLEAPLFVKSRKTPVLLPDSNAPSVSRIQLLRQFAGFLLEMR